MPALSQQLRDAAITAFEEGDPIELDRLLAVEVTRAKSGKALAALIFDPELGTASMGDDGFGAGLASALIDAADAFSKASDVATTLAVASRLVSTDPGAITRVSPAPGDENKAEYRDGLVARLPRVREWLGARAVSVRTAAAYTLGTASTLSSDVGLLLEASTQADERLVGTSLLAAAVIAARTGDSKLLLEVSSRIGALGPEVSPFTRVCEVAARRSLGEAVAAHAGSALVSALSSSERLPDGWGWFSEPSKCKTASLGDLATRFLDAVPETQRSEVVHALLKKPRLSEEDVALLLRVAFAGGAEVPALGLVLEDLREYQRAALEVLTRRGLAVMRAQMVSLGFNHGSHIAGFLAAENVMWKPIPIEHEGRIHHWAPLRILRGVLYGELEENAASSALTSGISADGLCDLLGEGLRTGLTSHPGLPASPEGNDRVQEVLLGLWQWLESEGRVEPDVLERRAAAGKDKVTAGLLSLWHATRGRALTTEQEAEIEAASKLARGRQPFARLLAELAESR